MGRYRYVVFGAGRQGTAAIHDLASNCDAKEIKVVEPDAARAKTARARIEKLVDKDSVAVSYLQSATSADIDRSDVVLSCAPYGANLALTRMALDADVPFCDLGGNPETVAEQERLAAKSKTPVVPDCGVSPGLSNILAVHCAREHGADEVHVRCGGLPLERPDAASNPLQYKLVFSPMGLISEYSGQVPVIRGGRVTSVEALSLTEDFDAEHESSPTSNNSPQVVGYLAGIGVREYDYMTVRYDGHWGLARGWKSLGYLCGDAARDEDLAQRLAADRALKYDPAKDRDKLILAVRGSKTVNGFRRGFEYRLDVAADKKTKFSAMELTTSWGITIVAHHIASARGVPKGFATPERFVDTSWVIAEIERRLAQVAK
ncbi:MAG TPA: saccharopine dehydrogenase C-terminal domain-containing protein [Planctomycetota bacterium]|jgi:saccharopine dehydrogenase-like NADP-dependent oxidoreductase|nr:saccharopine dehydrogenase C-terminal domain-containing protein [Planctomycetota bacterium]